MLLFNVHRVFFDLPLMSRFAKVPIEVLQDDRLTKKDLNVLIALYAHADKTGYCFPSRKTISNISKVHLSDITRVTARLREFGWVTKKGSGGNSGSARYQLHIPCGESPQGCGDSQHPPAVIAAPLPLFPMVNHHREGAVIHRTRTDQQQTNF